MTIVMYRETEPRPPCSDSRRTVWHRSLHLPQLCVCQCAELNEAIAGGQRIASYSVLLNNGLLLANGSTVGHRRLQPFALASAVSVSSVRVVVASAYGTPRLSGAAVHAAGTWHDKLRMTAVDR